MWTGPEKIALVMMARAGDSSADIGDELGRSPDAVRRMAILLRQPLRHGCPVDAMQRARLLDFLAQFPGSTLADFARFAGRSKNSVGVMARKLTREGLLERTGGPKRTCRYVVTKKWVVNDERITARV